MNIIAKVIALALVVFISLSSCQRTSKAITATDIITVTGMLEQQGPTTYQYGTHKLVATDQTYILKSSTLTLDNYVGQHVMITARNLHYTVENGPELYDVLTVTKQ